MTPPPPLPVVPDPTSPRSTTTTLTPRSANSRAIAAPHDDPFAARITRRAALVVQPPLAGETCVRVRLRARREDVSRRRARLRRTDEREVHQRAPLLPLP